MKHVFLARVIEIWMLYQVFYKYRIWNSEYLLFLHESQALASII